MKILAWLVIPALFSTSLAADILSSSGFANCNPNAEIRVNHANITFDRSSGIVYFDVSGTSTKEQNVTASLSVTAYGQEVYSRTFNPCEEHVTQLCPVPEGTFGANGSQVIPEQFLSQIPSIAFTIPDLDGQATLQLTGGQGNTTLGCIQAGVTNGKTVSIPAVPYVAAGVAVAALALSGFAALGSAGLVGAPAPAVSFSTVIGWFQSMSMNGMHSVNYPPVYRSFSQNFGFSSGLIPWDQMQTAIDNFRSSTGGNLTNDSVQFLRNSTLTYTDGSNSSSSSFDFGKRDITTSTNSTEDASSNPQVNNIVHGIGGYVEALTIPQANTFMTVLLIFAIVIAAITVGILLLKVILEGWALFGSFPKRLTGFRKRYWMTLAKTITQLILLLYGIWVLYCIFQFTNGDSWAAKLLAGVTLAIFTGVLLFFTIKIIIIARRYKALEGDSSALYDNKETWLKYSLFYDSYRQGYWWLFVPSIIYMFAKGCVLAAGDGHGLTQTAGQLIVESLMFILLLWTRPFATRGSQIINIFIQFVRVLSVVCILVFVEELGIAQTTKTITGVVLIAVQAGLTGVLAILIAVNAITMCCRENPHRKKRKEAEKMNREFDTLTPLDPRNSLLVLPLDNKSEQVLSGPYANRGTGYAPLNNGQKSGSTEHLVPKAASLGMSAPPVSAQNATMTAKGPERPYTPSIYSDYAGPTAATNPPMRQNINPAAGAWRQSRQPAFPSFVGIPNQRPAQRPYPGYNGGGGMVNPSMAQRPGPYQNLNQGYGPPRRYEEGRRF